jgi:hypothetical protein
VTRARALRILLALTALAALGFAGLRWFADRTGVDGWDQRTVPIANRGVTDAAIRQRFGDHPKGLDTRAYEDAFLYLLEGFVNYRSSAGARVYYPGTPSRNGRTSDGLEGFARFFPIAASWLASGRPDTIVLGGNTVSLERILREGLLAGTRRGGAEFWGVITSNNQRLVESADIALGLWLSRERLWARLEPAERAQVSTWLKRALVVDAYEGNWSLFPILVRRVLVALGEDVCCDEIVVDRYWRQFKQLAMGGGWIADGLQGADYYNAWAMQYVMFWLDQIDPAFDPQFIRESNRAMVAFYQHLMSPRGAPLMGRSVCYRMATPVPLLTAQVLSPGTVSPGRAMRALDAAWGWFVTHGALADGGITQGFCGKDLALVNDYTAPASCLWGARGLVVALYLDPRLHLLDAPREPLPVEAGDFEVTETALGWTVRGTRARGEVVLTITGNPGGPEQPTIRPYTTRHALREWLTHRPSRPNNQDALYKRREYSTEQTMTRCEPAQR